ncbi:MAG TPA: diaminopimelate epimerase [Stellaceae bacterium]|nr:diaminopimelate epimerase [Stellaceae bacterium]
MVAFVKMHGLGNDFVVLDCRRAPLALDAAGARALADRHTGVGCDQVILIEPPKSPKAHVFMRILNPDGSEAEACGNATRCLARLLRPETGGGPLRIETAAGLLDAQSLADGRIGVDMGPARTLWQEIPLARAMDTLAADIAEGPLAMPVCTNIGNPHATFFVNEPEAIDLASLGPRLEHHPVFPERANIGVASVRDPRHIRLRVWERGTGLTRACGSGACAALVAAHRLGLAERRAEVILDGGTLEIEWRADGHVLMTGPATLAFEGRFDAAMLKAGR